LILRVGLMNGNLKINSALVIIKPVIYRKQHSARVSNTPPQEGTLGANPNMRYLLTD
jgi:hypothetical protein